MICRTHVITALLSVSVLAVTAQTKPLPTAQELWVKSRTQGGKTPLQATLSVTLWNEQGNASETRSRFLRDGNGRTRTEYLLPKKDKGRIVILDGVTRWQYEPSKPLLIQSPFVMRQPESGEAQVSLRGYRIALDAKPQILSGRKCFVLLLAPKYTGLGMQSRWIDAQTFATLQTETRLGDGSLASRVTYSDVQYRITPKASDFVPPAASGTKTIHQPAPDAKQTDAEMARLAREKGLIADTSLGFRLKRVLTQQKSKQFLYSDGLLFLSLFVQDGFADNPKPRAPWKPFQIGKLTVHELKRPHSNVMVWMKQGRRYSLMARVAPEALREFVRTVLL